MRKANAKWKDMNMQQIRFEMSISEKYQLGLLYKFYKINNIHGNDMVPKGLTLEAFWVISEYVWAFRVYLIEYRKR